MTQRPTSRVLDWLPAPVVRAGFAGDSGPGSGEGGGDRLLAVDFESAEPGSYSPSSEQWGGFPVDVHSEEHLAVVDTDERGRVLEARFPAGVEGAGNGNGGGDFLVDLGEPREELYCAYSVRFCEGFEFHQPGGKLPGLIGTNAAGERAITGGIDPDGENGWSARMMWRDPSGPRDGVSVESSGDRGAADASAARSDDSAAADGPPASSDALGDRPRRGVAMFYVYHPDRPGAWGDNLFWDDGTAGQRQFEPGEWHRVEHRVAMNSPGERDGVLQGRFDGELAFERRDLRFRDVPGLGVDAFYFSTFFGGDRTETWAHDRAERIQFDDLVVSTAPIDAGARTD